MRIACVLVEHFIAFVTERQRPELAGSPFVIGGLPHERKTVMDVSPAASECGVSPGMSLREAGQRCPQATFLPNDDRLYWQTFHTMLTALEAFTPAVAEDGLGCAYLDLHRLALPPGGEQALAAELAGAVFDATGTNPGVGLARSIFVARAAVACAGNGRTVVVKQGEERSFLAPLPISVLPLSVEALRRLRLLGLNTVGALADLPAQAVASQLGKEGTIAHRLANGIDERVVPARQSIDFVAEEREFAEPLTTEDHAFMAITHIVDQLLPVLQREHLFCRQVRVEVRLENQERQDSLANLREASQDGAVITRAALRLLSAHCHSGITAIRVVLTELCGPQGQQLALFAPRHGRLEKLAEATSQIKSRLGEGRLRKAVIVNAQANLPERRFTFVEYR